MVTGKPARVHSGSISGVDHADETGAHLWTCVAQSASHTAPKTMPSGPLNVHTAQSTQGRRESDYASLLASPLLLGD